MAVVALIHAACPATAPIGDNPPARTRRFLQPETLPCGARRWMFQHAAPPSHRFQGHQKAPAIIPALAANPGARPAVPIPAPPLTRRMGDDRVWPFVQPGVPFNRPQFNIWQIRIGAITQYKQRRRHATASVSCSFGGTSEGFGWSRNQKFSVGVNHAGTFPSAINRMSASLRSTRALPRLARFLFRCADPDQARPGESRAPSGARRARSADHPWPDPVPKFASRTHPRVL